VEGKLATRKYEKDGVRHYATEVRAQTVGFLDRRDRAAADEPGAEGGNEPSPPPRSLRRAGPQRLEACPTKNPKPDNLRNPSGLLVNPRAGPDSRRG
jgi:single-stranded DNA-binding protein